MAGVKNPNTIWKSQSKQNLATYFTQPLESKDCSAVLKHPTLMEAFLSKQGLKGKSRGTWNNKITVNE
jgi:hypothetical protein